MDNDTKIKSLSWSAHEHEHREKSKDWYWSLGILTVTALILSIVFSNYIFGVLILIIGFSLAIVGSKEPRLIDFELNTTGVKIDKQLFPYSTLEAFWVENNQDNHLPSQLLIKSKKAVMPLIIMPLENTDPEAVRDFLLYRLLEKELSEPFLQFVLENLGF